jgi:putative transcriptional regulator
MSEGNIISVRRLDDGTFVQELADSTFRRIESRTDWARLAAMTEEEIEANALADEDNPPFTDEELARMQPVLCPRDVRRRLRLTQEEFSTRFQLPIGTIRDWEQGKKKPDSAARILLRIIDRNPEAVIQALKQ